MRQVLYQSPAQPDVENLQSAANREDGHALSESPLQQAEFQLIAFPIGLGCGVRLSSISLGIYIQTARQQQSADPRKVSR